MESQKHSKKNNLSISHPILSVEAYGWDPNFVTAGSSKNRKWKCKTCEGIWETSIYNRAVLGKGFCDKHPRVKNGSKSLLAEFPIISEEASGWNPDDFSSHSGKIMTWKCLLCQYIWPARISHRTNPATMSGCPRCSGKQTESFLTAYPNLAYEAFLWDPSLYTSGSNVVLKWLCGDCKTKWEASPKQRVQNTLAWGCPKCHLQAGKYREFYGQRIRISKKCNSLVTRYPILTQELVDPSIGRLISYGSSLIVPWYCVLCDKIWEAPVNSRTSHGNGCPNHTKNGYNINEPGIVYFLIAKRKGQEIIQYGITKDIKARLSYHRRNGFEVPKESYFLRFFNGKDALFIEKEIRKTLLNKGVYSVKDDPTFKDRFEGFSEAFRKELLPVDSLPDLLKILKIKTVGLESEWVKVKSKDLT